MKEEPGNCRPVSLASALGKIMKKIILGAIARHLKKKAIIKCSQCGFMTGKSCLTNLISFHNKVTCLVDQEKEELMQSFWILVRPLISSLMASFWINSPPVRRTGSCYAG